MAKQKKNIDGFSVAKKINYSQKDGFFRLDWEKDRLVSFIATWLNSLVEWWKKEGQISRTSLEWSSSWQEMTKFFRINYKYVLGTVVLIGLSSLLTYNLWGVKNRVVQAAEAGTDRMKSGVEQLKKEDFAAAAENFAAANLEFSTIKRELSRAGQGENFLAGSLPADEYDNINLAVDGLISMSRGAKLLSLGLKEVADYSGGDFSGLLVGILTNKEGSENILPVVDKAGDYFAKSTVELENGINLFGQIDEKRVPDAYKKWFELIKKDSPRYLSLLTGMNSFFRDLDQLLGREVPVNYLLLFQNYNEIRPTGGFIGSYGLVQFQEGKMTKLFFDDIYNPDGQMMEKITPPYPISMMTKTWEMRDSNWDPDFPTTAINAMGMFEKEGGFTVDGVLAFTPEVVNRFLALTGPVEMPAYGVTLDEKNFTAEIQRKVELEYDPVENKPKKILGDLLPVLMDRLANLPEEHKEKFWQTMLDLLTEKHILAYSFNPDIEKLIIDVGWGGEVKKLGPNEDYLNLVHANIGGRKSDLFIKEAVKHAVTIDGNGDYIVDLEITRKNIEDWTWPNYSNYDYLRVYVPEGSELLAVDGFVNPEGMIIENGVITYDKTKGEVGLGNTKVYSENGKTVFGNWMVTDPWSASVVRYRYKLPFKPQEKYSLYCQKQSGRGEIDYLYKFSPGNDWLVDGSSLEIVDNQGEYFWRDNMKKDFSLVFDLRKK